MERRAPLGTSRTCSGCNGHARSPTIASPEPAITTIRTSRSRFTCSATSSPGGQESSVALRSSLAVPQSGPSPESRLRSTCWVSIGFKSYLPHRVRPVDGYCGQHRQPLSPGGRFGPTMGNMTDLDVMGGFDFRSARLVLFAGLLATLLVLAWFASPARAGDRVYWVNDNSPKRISFAELDG